MAITRINPEYAAVSHTHEPGQVNGLGTLLYDDISNAKNIPSGTWTLLGYVTLTPGRWILTGNVMFTGNSSGTRYMVVQEAAVEPATGQYHIYMVSQTPISGSTCMSKTIVRTASQENSKFGIWVYQNSGSGIPCVGYMQAVRIM